MRKRKVVANVTQQNQLTAAVTGAGSGLGRDIALGLAAKNYQVFGTALSTQEIDDLKNASDGAVSLSQYDITDEAAVRNWGRTIDRPYQPDVGSEDRTLKD